MENDQPDIRVPPVAPALCPLCQSEIEEDANFCAYCGKQINRSGLGLTRWAGYLVLVLLVAGALGVYFHWRQPEIVPAGSLVSQPIKPVEKRKPKRQAVLVPQVSTPVEVVAPSIRLAAGTVVLNDITGNEIARIPVAVLAGGWLALPKRACLGGYDWQFLTGAGPPIPIEEGIAADDDAIGLWRLQSSAIPDTAPLAAWQPDRPLTWIGLTAGGEPEPVLVSLIGQGTNIALVQVGGGDMETGYFLQAADVVGWTFGDLAEGGFLWLGADGPDRLADLRVDDFYRISFANSREEEFLRALALTEEYSDIERLAMFAGALRFESRVDPKDLRPELQSDAVFEQMRVLIGRGIDADLAVEVAAQFDAEVLSRAADADLILDIVRAAAAGNGYDVALALLENTMDLLPSTSTRELDRLKLAQAEIYRIWLAELIQAQDFLSAAQAFEDGRQRLPDDLNIHLLGVNLALAQNDWTEAERLLAMKSYPSDLSTTVAGLQAQIQDLKTQAGAIVIQFAPGSRQIPVVATLDGGVRQQFIVDTGASLVTIPSQTARELGLIVNVRSPRRTIYTAGGVITAPEVVLPAIEIDGWEVRNVTALVVDLPDELGWGLLGMNYLRRFRMDLNTEEGMLLLEPR